MIALYDQRRTLTAPVVQYVNHCKLDTVFVLIPEIEPEHIWQRLLQNQRGAILAHALRRRTNAVVCRMRFRIPDEDTGTPDPSPTLISIGQG